MPQIIMRNLAIAICFNLLLTSSGYGLTIFFPKSKANLFSDSVHLVGSIPTSKGATIRINGKVVDIGTYRKITDKDGVRYLFVENLPLQSGENHIEVRYQNEKQQLTVQYISKAIAYRDHIRKESYFHMDEQKEVCGLCHNYNTANDCKQCHEDKHMGEYVHGPVAAWQCFQCHDKNNYFAASQPISSKCLNCHQEFSASMYEAKFAHGPVAAGYCNICHTPHVSNNKYLLYDDVNTLCNNCHTDKKTGIHVMSNLKGEGHPTDGAIIKSTGKEISCVSCHNPHYGEVSQMYQEGASDFMKLCVKCHEDKM